MNMSDKNTVSSYLQAFADLSCFYIIVGREIRGGLIGYVDRNGRAWTLMEDDEELADACLEFLRGLPAPEFDSTDKEETFISYAKDRLRASQ